MPPSVKHLRAIRVLLADCGDLLVAIPVAQAGRAVAIRASARLPGTPGWVAGIARADAHSIWLLDVHGTPANHAGRAAPFSLALLAAGSEPRWGLAIDRVEAFGIASPASASSQQAGQHAGWPADWSASCLLADGRDALLIDPTAITRDLATTAA